MTCVVLRTYLKEARMTDKQKIKLLKNCFEETIWMAIRYAHGRHTYAPSMVRMAVNDFKKVFPDWELRTDITIEPPSEAKLSAFALRSDYLNDLFNPDGEPLEISAEKIAEVRALSIANAMHRFWNILHVEVAVEKVYVVTEALGVIAITKNGIYPVSSTCCPKTTK